MRWQEMRCERSGWSERPELGGNVRVTGVELGQGAEVRQLSPVDGEGLVE